MSAPLTVTQIPCCLCGTMIVPNNANKCPSCLAQDYNLHDILQRGPGGENHSTIHQCRQCRRYKQTEKHYIDADPESPELLALCLKHIPALQPNASPVLHLVDAGWIWTEPHSMRFKLRLTVRSEIQNVTVQQRVAVELHCQFQMCKDCNREYTNRTWHALVQLRQKQRDHQAPKKGLAALEMAIYKNKHIRKHVLRIDSAKNGLDFYFLNLQHAQAFVSFLQTAAPMRVKSSKKLVSTDVKNNTANLKHTLTCDVVPLCKDDLVLIHKSARNKLAGRLVIVSKLASGVIHLIDASPKRENLAESQMELSAETYYKHEKHYSVLQASHRMTRFVALDVELCDRSGSSGKLYEGPASGVEKYALADVQVARESDFGSNDETLSTVTHLGHLVREGDVVAGYDLAATIGGDWELEESFHSSFVMPDVVLIKKVAGDSSTTDDGSANDEFSGKRRISKKKERRLRKEGKRRRELEESAVRMGFFEDEADHQAALEAELAEDPELAAEVMALERDFEALEAPLMEGEEEDTTAKVEIEEDAPE